MALHPLISIDDVCEALSADEDLGWCTACGSEHTVEADARNVRCDCCGALAVQGAHGIVALLEKEV